MNPDLKQKSTVGGGKPQIPQPQPAEGLMERKPLNYWKSWENYKLEMWYEIACEYTDQNGVVIKKAGEFPIQPRLIQTGRSDLSNSARYHDGLNAVRKKMGYGVVHVKRSHWTDWENFKSEIWYETACEYVNEKGAITKKAGEFPTKRQLRIAGRSDIIGAAKHYDGLNAVRMRMERDIIYCRWQSWDYFKSEMEKEIDKEYVDGKGNVIKKAGEFPTNPQLSRAGRSDLLHAANNYYGNINDVRRKMGYDIIRSEPGYWKDWEKYKTAMEKEIAKEYDDENGVFKNAGEFPTETQLIRTGHSDLFSAAFKYHGSMNAVRTRMGLSGADAAITNESFNYAVLSAMKQFVMEAGA